MNIIDLYIKKLLSGSTVPDEQTMVVCHILLLMDQLFSNDEVNDTFPPPNPLRYAHVLNITATTYHPSRTPERTLPSTSTHNRVSIQIYS